MSIFITARIGLSLLTLDAVTLASCHCFSKRAVVQTFVGKNRQNSWIDTRWVTLTAFGGRNFHSSRKCCRCCWQTVDGSLATRWQYGMTFDCRDVVVYRVSMPAVVVGHCAAVCVPHCGVSWRLVFPRSIRCIIAIFEMYIYCAIGWSFSFDFKLLIKSAFFGRDGFQR